MMDCTLQFQEESVTSDQAESNDNRPEAEHHNTGDDSQAAENSAARSDKQLSNTSILKGSQSIQTDTKSSTAKPSHVKSVKLPNADSTDKTQSSLDKFVKTPVGQRRPPRNHTPPTPPDNVSSGPKKSKN